MYQCTNVNFVNKGMPEFKLKFIEYLCGYFRLCSDRLYQVAAFAWHSSLPTSDSGRPTMMVWYRFYSNSNEVQATCRWALARYHHLLDCFKTTCSKNVRSRATLTCTLTSDLLLSLVWIRCSAQHRFCESSVLRCVCVWLCHVFSQEKLNKTKIKESKK